MRQNAVTGQPEPWSIMRTGHHCGMITGCENMLFFRSGYTGFYDLTADVGRAALRRDIASAAGSTPCRPTDW